MSSHFLPALAAGLAGWAAGLRAAGADLAAGRAGAGLFAGQAAGLDAPRAAGLDASRAGAGFFAAPRAEAGFEGFGGSQTGSRFRAA